MNRFFDRTAPDLWTASKRAVDDLRSSWLAIVSAGLLLLAGFAGGYVLTTPTQDSTTSNGGTVFPFDDPTALDIAINNLAVMIVLVAGALTLGALTLSMLLYNGFLLGGIVKSLVAGAGTTEVALLIVPHAVFELSGLVLAGAIGLTGAGNVMSYLFARRDDVVTRAELSSGLRLVVLATLLILWGAVIEIHVTPTLV